MWWILLIVIGLMFVYTIFFSNNIKVDDAREKLSAGAILVDVRTEGEFAMGAHPGAINIPMHKLGNISTEVKKKETPILLYCASGARAAGACARLRSMGYKDVYNVGSFSRCRKILTPPT
jgi:rhodanese-related sulfurtransferase